MSGTTTGYRLSPQQRRLWALGDDGYAFRAQCAVMVDGAVDRRALAVAVSALVARHDVLRTVYRRQAGFRFPLQVVEEAPAFRESTTLDWTGVPEAEQQARLDVLLADRRKAAIDLEHGPAIDPVIVRCGPERVALVLTLPALAADEPSLANLFRDLGPLYVSALGLGEAPEEPVQYAQFSEWLHELEPGDLAPGLDHWRRVPTDIGRREADGGEPFAPGAEPTTLDPALTEQLRKIAGTRSASLADLLTAAWVALERRLTEGDRIVVARRFDERKFEELGDAVGLFARHLPLAFDTPGDRRFDDLLREVVEAAQRAVEHEEAFDRAGGDEATAETVAPPRALAFEWRRDEEPFESGDVTFSLVRRFVCSEPFDASLSCRETRNGVELVVRHDLVRLDPGAARLLAERLVALLRSVAAEPTLRLDDAEVLAAFERPEIDGPPKKGPATVVEWLEERAARSPDDVAVVSESGETTFAELGRRSARIAGRLRALGVGADVRVALAAERSPALLAGVLGILRAGGAYVPLDAGLPQARRVFILKQSGASLVLADRAMRDWIPDGGPLVLSLEEAIVDGGSGELPPVSIDPDQLASVLFTSGSTGTPKGVMVTHGGLASYLAWAVETYFSGEGSEEGAGGALWHSPLGFDLTVTSLFGPLLAGASVALVAEEEGPGALVRRLREGGRYDVLKVTPSHLEVIGRMVPSEVLVSCARVLVVGGEALRPEALVPWLARPESAWIFNEYGPTETVVGCCVHRVAGPSDGTADGAGSVPIGRPIAGARLRIFNRRLRPVPPGSPGELAIGGAGVARGYLGRPATTAESFVPDPFAAEPGARVYRSGDRVRALPLGDLEFLGRIDRQVKIRGFRVELGEIESVLARHPAVAEAVVKARELGDSGDRTLTAYLVGRAEREGAGMPETEDIRAHAESHLPAYMVPSEFVVLAELPLTRNGKVDLDALPDPSARDGRTEDARELGPVEELVAGVWSQVLDRERIAAVDDFFRIGGHSLLATQVISRLNKLFDLGLPIEQLFETPTVEGLAAAVRELQGEGRGHRSLVPIEPFDRSGSAEPPLSFAQQRFWFLDRLHPGQPAYNVPVAVRAAGALDVSALAASLSKVAQRHEVLRTIYPERDGEPVQRVLLAGALPLPVVDLSGIDAARREAAAHDLAGREALGGFDLETGPVLRVSILRLAPQEHVILVTMHHIATDGRSMELLVRETMLLYGAAREYRPSPLPEPTLQYSDFAAWQRSRMQGETLERALDYWRQSLAGAPFVLDLPTDRPRGVAAGGAKGAEVPWTFTPGLSTAFQSLARRHGVTLFMAVTALFQLMLARLTGRDEVLIGTAAEGRGQPELQEILGCFVNTLVLRGDLRGEPSFVELLSRVRGVALGAYGHQELPFERLVEALQPERDLERTPLFQAMLVLRRTPPAAPGVRELRLTMEGRDRAVSPFDWQMWAFASGERLHGSLEFAADLFDRTTMQRSVDRFVRLAEAAVAEPERPVSRLPMLARAEAHQLRLEWNVSPATGPLPMPESFAAWAACEPDRIAVEMADRSWSYGGLAAEARRVASVLRRAGVPPDAVVGVCAPRSPGLVAAWLGVLETGAAYLPLDPSYPEERLTLMVEDSSAVAVLTAGRFSSAFARVTVPVLPLDPGTGGGETGSAPEATELRRDGSLRAYVIYTSGSTGRPKGVELTRSSLGRLFGALRERPGVGPEDRLLAVTSASFDIATAEMLLPLAVGARVVIATSDEVVDGERLQAAWERSRATGTQATPVTWTLLTGAGWPGSSPGFAVSGGERMSPALADRLVREERSYNFYGPAETTIWSAGGRVDPPSHGDHVPIGLPLDGTGIHVVSADLRLLPIGVHGELAHTGEGVGRGYLARPALTAERFVPDPFSGRRGARLYRSGDVGYRLPDGRLICEGRRDLQVKVRGRRIELNEIENALTTHPGVREAAVVVLGTEASERRLAGWFVLESGAGSVTPDDLRAFLRKRLPAFMVPSDLSELDALPVTSNLKVDRRALATRAPQTRGRRRIEAPRTPTEEILAGLWSAVLERPDVGVDESFFDLGGHSLLATRLVARVRDVFGVDLPVSAVFDSPTVEGLARRIVVAPAGEERPPSPRPRPGDGRWPLTTAQAGLWALAQIEPDGTAYNLFQGVRIAGPLDAGALRTALAAAVARHESLRTTFEGDEDGAWQRVHPPSPVSLPLHDLSELPQARRSAALDTLVEAERIRPFDLATGPVVRALLARLAPDDHALLLTLHHIVADGWSIGLLVRDLSAIYRAATQGAGKGGAELPPVRVQLADYAVWQRERLADGVLDRRLDAWLDRLRGAPTLLDLPTDRPRSAATSRRGGRVTLRFDAELAESLRRLARRAGATPFMAFAAGFQALLGRYVGRDDLLLGVVTANRRHVELEATVGLFANTLVLRADLGGRPAFGDLLARVRDATLEALRLGDVPFETLVDALRPEREAADSPVVQAVIVLQNLPSVGVSAGDLDLRPIEAAGGDAKFDLTLGLSEAAGDVAATFEYRRDLFDATTVERMARHLRRLLAAAVMEPERPVAELPVLGDGESQMVTREWGGRTESPAANLFERFCDRVRIAPEAIAVSAPGEVLSYRELAGRAERLASRLWARGARPGDLIGLFLGRSAALPVAVLAVLRAGCAYLPLDPAYPPDRLALMLEDSRVSLVVTEPGGEEPLPEGVWSLVDVQAGEDAPSPPPPPARVPPEAAAYVIYTSGSTGRPKGCVVTHGNVSRLLSATDPWFGFGAEDVWTLCHSYAFDVSVWELWGAFAYGGRLELVSHWVTRSPDELRDLLARERVTVLSHTPSAFRQLVAADERAPSVDFALRYVVFGGEALDLASVASWFRRHGDDRPRLINMYGITETTVHVTWRWIRLADVERADRSPIGVAIPDLSIVLTSPGGDAVPIGAPGEIRVGGAGLATGYLGRPALTAERFVPDPWSATPGGRAYRSGDMARRRPNGELDFLGRADHQVKIRGFRIEPGEIEVCLGSHPAVRESVVVARSVTGPSDERAALVAYLVAAGEAPPVTELRGHLLERLPDYMVPSVFVFLDALPMTPSGKLDRRSLPAPRVEGGGREASPEDRPRRPAERVLARLWSELLGVPSLGLRDNFFELGGDSIVAMQVVARAKRFGVHLTPRQVFDHQTLGALAAVASSEATAMVDQGPVVGLAPLTPIQETFFGWRLEDPEHYGQALLFEIDGPRRSLRFAPLRRSVAALLTHHDALRSRFEEAADGWRQEVVAPEVVRPRCHRVDLSALPESARRRAVESGAAGAQTGFDLGAPPLLRAVVFGPGPGGGDRLLLVAHHLVIDGVSWRVLLQDLWSAYDRAVSGEEIELPPKTTSFREWAERLAAHAGSDAVRGEAAYWRAALPGLAPRLPLDDPEAVDTRGGTRRVTISLDEAETAELIRSSATAFRAGIQEVLVAAVASALAEWTGSRRVLLDVEGHGRAEIFDGIDLSRTVGWFTTIHPIEIDLGRDHDPVAGLRRVKGALRAVPVEGLGYGLLRAVDPDSVPDPEPEVSFNYLGQIDRGIGAQGTGDQGAGSRPAPEDPGPTRGPRQRRSHRIEIDGAVTAGRLRLVWTYGAGLRRETVERVAQAGLHTLRELLTAARSPSRAAFLPSDFPLAGLDERMLHDVLEVPGEVEDLYPAAPAQRGVLFQSLSNRKAGVYVCQLCCRLEGAVREDWLAEAWRHLVTRHPALRTGFSWWLTDDPLQVVWRDVPAPFESLDWRGRREDEARAALEELLLADRTRGFALDRPPLARATLVRTGERSRWLVWTFHHLVADGWSLPVLLHEMAELYAAAAEERPSSLAPAPPYRDYVAWLATRDRDAAERHWRETLAGFDRPLSIGGPERDEPMGSGTHHGVVPADLTAALEETARRYRLTLATVIQGAWALLLGHWGRAEDVVIGNVVSGRPAEVEGSRTMVGMFVGAVPLRVSVEPERSLVDWLAALQRREQASKEHGHVSLADIRRHADVPSGTALFEHTFVFNNYPTEVDGGAALAGERAGERAGDLRFAEIREEETTQYALDLMLARRADLRLRVLYDPRRFEPARIETAADALLTLLRSMAERPEAAVGEHLEVLDGSGLREAPARTFGRVRPREIVISERPGGGKE